MMWYVIQNREAEKGGPAPPKKGDTLSSAGCIVQLPTPLPYAETRHPVPARRRNLFNPGKSCPQSARLYRAEWAIQQAKRLLTTTSGRHLEDTALLPLRPRTVSLRSLERLCGITSRIKRHFRLG